MLQLVAVTLALVAVVIGWLHGGQPNSICPARAEIDEARTQGLLRLLRGVQEASTLSESERQRLAPFVCYGDTSEGVLRNDGVFLLPQAEGDASNAARLAHLVLHQREALPLDDRAIVGNELTCPELVQRVMQSEHGAHALEGRLRRTFGLGPTSDTLPELQAAYSRRCRALRSAAGTL